jgi:hypothetical protein
MMVCATAILGLRARTAPQKFVLTGALDTEFAPPTISHAAAIPAGLVMTAHSMPAHVTAATTDTASTELATVRLAGPARPAQRRLALLTATTKVIVLVVHVFATPSTPDVIAPFNSAPTRALELVPASTLLAFATLAGLARTAHFVLALMTAQRRVFATMPPATASWDSQALIAP